MRVLAATLLSLFLATPLLASPAPVLASPPAPAIARPLAPAFAAAEPDVIRQSQWQLSALKLTDVHKRSTGKGLTVAVVDSGVDGVHPDLTGQVSPGGPETSNNDFDGRGTALAGLIAGHGHTSAAGGSDAGILGVAPGAKVLPVAYAPLSGESGGDPDRLATGIELAISRGANIICVARASVPSERLQFAIEVAVLKGVLVVTAETSAWPASYPGVLTAIPTDSGGLVRTLSSSGRSTGVAVPGEGLMAPHLLGGYRQADPHAAAAAILAGSAAVVWSANPDAKADQIVALLRKTAADAGPSGPDTQYGAGKVDLTAALKAGVTTATPTPSVSPPGKTAAVKPPAVAKGTVNPLVHSRELGRWLVLLPVVLFFGGFAAWAFHKSRSRVN